MSKVDDLEDFLKDVETITVVSAKPSEGCEELLKDEEGETEEIVQSRPVFESDEEGYEDVDNLDEYADEILKRLKTKVTRDRERKPVKNKSKNRVGILEFLCNTALRIVIIVIIPIILILGVKLLMYLWNSGVQEIPVGFFEK